MLKRKSLTVFMAVAALSLITAVCGIKVGSAVYADGSDGTVTVTEGFTFEEGSKNTVITGLELPVTVEGEYEIVIPENVTAIADNAFENSENLVGVTLCDGLVTIGDYAFTGTDIVSLTVPASVTSIGEHAFDGCTALTELTFEEEPIKDTESGEEGDTESEEDETAGGEEIAAKRVLSIKVNAFERCAGLRTVSVPDNTVINHSAFAGCTSLAWFYVGNGCTFADSTGGMSGVKFFPTNTNLNIVFPSADEYNAVLNRDTTFKNVHEAFATYLVKVNCYVGASKTPVVYERLHGEPFNYVKDAAGVWNTDTAYSALPAQDIDENYSAISWYAEDTLENRLSYEQVNALLGTESEIKLYCHELIAVPAFPSEPVSWIYDKKVSYKINDISDVLEALDCKSKFSEEQLKAIDFTVVFADEKGKIAQTPDEIKGNGVYSVSFSLKDEYGSWAQTVTSSITINVDTTGFTVAMIVLLVVGLLAAVITVSTAVIRKKVQAKNKKKQLSQQEIIEKFKATGEETTLS